jgi:hypothetical protein
MATMVTFSPGIQDSVAMQRSSGGASCATGGTEGSGPKARKLSGKKALQQAQTERKESRKKK